MSVVGFMMFVAEYALRTRPGRVWVEYEWLVFEPSNAGTAVAWC